MSNDAGFSGSAEPTPPQAPTPPPAAPGYPAGSSAGSSPLGFDPKSLQNFDPKTINPLDWGIIGAGLLTFIFSLFNFYVSKVKVGGISESGGGENGWHGPLAPLAILLAIAASGLLAAHLIAKLTIPVAVPTRLIVLGAYAVAALFLLLAFFIHPGSGSGVSGPGFSVKVGHGFGYWITLLIALGATGLSYVRFTQTGGKLPGRT